MSDAYGRIDVFNGAQTRSCTIGVFYPGTMIAKGGPPRPLTLDDMTEDIVLDPSGHVVRHPLDGPRESTEEERAAVGWTW